MQHNGKNSAPQSFFYLTFMLFLICYLDNVWSQSFHLNNFFPNRFKQACGIQYYSDIVLLSYGFIIVFIWNILNIKKRNLFIEIWIKTNNGIIKFEKLYRKFDSIQNRACQKINAFCLIGHISLLQLNKTINIIYYAQYIRLIKAHMQLHNKQHTNSFIKNNILLYK